MGATITPLSATFLGYRDHDKPVLLPRNLLLDADDVRANITRKFTTADGSDASYPITSLYDLFRGAQWRYGSSQATVYVLADFGAPVSVDAILFEGDDGYQDGDTFTVQASDDLVLAGPTADELDTPTTVYTTVLGSGRHVALLDNSYAARYWQISWSGANTIKRARQCWLATQVFLPHKSDVPYDEEEMTSNFVDAVAESGAAVRTTWFDDIGRREFTINIEDVDTIADLRAAFASSEGWGMPIWWIEDPDTDPDGTSLFGLLQDPGLALPSVLTQDKVWDGVIVESGPHLD